MAKSNKYFFIFHLSVIQSLKNYKLLIGLGLFLLTCLLVFAHLWKIAAAKMGGVHLNPEQLLWYIAFNQMVLIAIPDVDLDMELDLRSGKLAYLLPRPLSYLGSIFCESFGFFVVNWALLGAVAIFFTWWQIGIFPFSALNFITMLALSFFAGVVAILFRMMVGIFAFWLQEITPIHWIWEKLLFALGGLLLPLTVYPIWLQKIAHFTPFPAILGDRSALAIEFTWSAALNIGLKLFFWGLFATSSFLYLYRRGLKILNVEGG